MIRTTCFIFSIVFASGVSAWADEDLRSFSDAAIAAISSEVEEDSIRGWESHEVDGEVSVKIFTVDGTVFEAHCEESCKKVGQHRVNVTHTQNPKITLELITNGRNTAFDKLEKTLQLRGADIGALISYKTWAYENMGQGHDQGLNLWTQMVHEKKTVLVLCHPHPGGTELFCHYRAKFSQDISEGEEHHDHGEHHDDDEKEHHDHGEHHDGEEHHDHGKHHDEEEHHDHGEHHDEEEHNDHGKGHEH